MKNSFVIYVDYLEHIMLLTMEQRGLLFTALIQYASGSELPEMDGMTAMAFSFIKAQMDRDKAKYEKTVSARKEAGKLGGRPRKANGISEEAKKANGFFEKQTEAKKPDNDNVNVNDNDIKKKDPKGSKEKKHFVPPTLENIMGYCQESGYYVDAERFIDFYASKGWMVGKTKMKDWKATVRNWARSDTGGKRGGQQAGRNIATDESVTGELARRGIVADFDGF